jgi:hypothetical protein
MNPQDQREYQIVEDALRSLPQASVPPRFTVNLMRRVGQASQPRFRLAWMDLALSLFAACMLGLAGLTLAALPPLFDVYLRQEVYYWLQHMALHPEMAILLAGAAVLGLGSSLAAAVAAFQLRG